MTKSELIEVLADRGNLPVTQAEKIVNAVFKQMTAAMARGDRIEIRGFGSFSIRKYKGYMGRNLRKGEPISVSPKRLPYFKVGKDLKERINGGIKKPTDGDD